MDWNSPWSRLATVALVIGTWGLSLAGQTQAQPPGQEVTIPVTVHPHNQRTREAAARLQPADFVVREDRRPQQVLSVKKPGEALPEVAVVLQDDLVPRVSNELNGIKSSIRGLRQGSRVMTAYISVGSLRVTQEFTTDRERAAASLRMVLGTESARLVHTKNSWMCCAVSIRKHRGGES